MAEWPCAVTIQRRRTIVAVLVLWHEFANDARRQPFRFYPADKVERKAADISFRHCLRYTRAQAT